MPRDFVSIVKSTLQVLVCRLFSDCLALQFRLSTVTEGFKKK
jgi:hypothetical protein